MFVVDTNLLLYALNPDAKEHLQARALLEAWRRGDRSWFLTWGIIYEFLRVSTHARVLPHPLTIRQAIEWIDLLLASPRGDILTPTQRHLTILTSLGKDHPRLRGNVIHDLHTVALMREHGVTEIRTADTDFHQFGFLKVVNPLVDSAAQG